MIKNFTTTNSITEMYQHSNDEVYNLLLKTCNSQKGEVKLRKWRECESSTLSIKTKNVSRKVIKIFYYIESKSVNDRLNNDSLDNCAVKHKRIYRVYTDMKLNIRRRFRKRLPVRVKKALHQPDAINEVWSVDFMNDALWDGRRFRLLNIVDDYNREVLHIEADISLPTMRLIRFFGIFKRVQRVTKNDPG